MRWPVSLTVFAAIIGFVNACAKNHKNIPNVLFSGVATFTTSPYSGQVFFAPNADKTIRVTGSITGLPKDGVFGVHIHTNGNLGRNCADANGHWNPFNENHGSLTSNVRHQGDLGNLATDATGEMKFDLTISTDPRDPTCGFIGLSLVVHSGTDDLGLGGDQGSMSTGNSGSRLTCAVIGLKDSPTIYY